MTPSRPTHACDYLIVGGGTAGCVLAARLSEDPACRVVLLEAGDADNHPLLAVPGATAITATVPRFNWSLATEAEPEMADRKLFISQGRVLGGGSSINGLVYTRGQPWDYDHWRDLGATGWGFDDVLPFFRQSETNERGASHWHGDAGPVKIARGRSDLEICEPFLAACGAAGVPVVDDLNVGQSDGVGYFDSFIHRGRRSSSASSYLRPARQRPNLTVVTNALATRLILDGDRVAGCEYTQNGVTCSALATTETVLSAGAIQSPRLLMLSGIGHAAKLEALGIKVAAHAPEVGANLQNHVALKLTWTCVKPITAYRYLNPWRAAASGVEYLLARSGYLAQLPTPIGGFLRTDSSLPCPDIQIFINPALVGRFDQGLLKMLPKEHGFSVFVNQGRPWSRGEVSLSSNSPTAPMRIEGRYLSDRRDRDVLARGVEMMRDIVQGGPLAPTIGKQLLPGDAVRTRAELDAFITANASNYWHVSGTCRMGSDDDAVVDSRLCVRGVRGLRVADASIMPTLINGNTSGPIMMIAEKAAAMMREDRGNL